MKHAYRIHLTFQVTRKLTSLEFISLVNACAVQIENPYIYGGDGELIKADFSTTVDWSSEEVAQ